MYMPKPDSFWPVSEGSRGSYEHPPCQLPCRAIYRDAPPVKGASDMWRKCLNPSKFSPLPRPVEFVFLASVKQIVFRGSVIQRGFDGQAHDDKAGTVFRK